MYFIFLFKKISTLKVVKGGEERTVRHFHYLEWPVYQIADSSSFLLFLNHLQEELDKLDNCSIPAIVHCHDGCGRTGAFLAIQVKHSLIQFMAP